MNPEMSNKGRVDKGGPTEREGERMNGRCMVFLAFLYKVISVK